MYAANNCVLHHAHAESSTTTCATGTAATCEWAQDAGLAARLRPDRDPHLFGVRCRASAWPRRARRPAASRRSACANGSTPISIPAVLVPAARSAGQRLRGLSAGRGDAAADGDVPLVGFAERLAAPDPHRTTTCSSIRRRRRRRASPTAAGCWVERLGQGALHVPLQRSGGAGHGVDLERDRQGRRRLAAGTRCANESEKGFLLNHLIREELPADARRRARISNSDPVTGQAGWYDVRVRIRQGRRPTSPQTQACAAVRARVPPCCAGREAARAGARRVTGTRRASPRRQSSASAGHAVTQLAPRSST